jgi:hypothetical protein
MHSVMFPPSLPQTIKDRSFLAGNGELGLFPEDVPLFLDACQSDGVPVLGWEVWLADHDWPPTGNEPTLARGNWCGLIPMRNQKLPYVISASGDLGETRKGLAALDLNDIDPKWAPFVRINITLD